MGGWPAGGRGAPRRSPGGGRGGADLLLPATADRLHQGYRRPAYPRSAALVDALRERGIAAAISGAGPSVLALTVDAALPDDLDLTGFTLLPLAVDTEGARVELG